jgi:hypothetical protein
MEEDEDGIGEFSVQDQEDPQILVIITHIEPTRRVFGKEIE